MRLERPRQIQKHQSPGTRISYNFTRFSCHIDVTTMSHILLRLHLKRGRCYGLCGLNLSKKHWKKNILFAADRNKDLRSTNLLVFNDAPMFFRYSDTTFRLSGTCTSWWVQPFPKWTLRSQRLRQEHALESHQQ